MNCYLHPDTAAAAFCRSCGRPLCAVCERPAEGTVFCQDHVPAAPQMDAADPSNPYVQPGPAPVPSPVHTSPGLAFLLGWIPGVGAIYNGQYLKGLVHAVIFGLLISLVNSADNTPGEPLLGVILMGFMFYMPFEAYHTAKKRQLGVPVDEWSSFISQNRPAGRAPVGPIILIVIGILFLLDTLHIVEFREIGRFWPIILIVVGAYMLWSRISPSSRIPPPVGPPLPDDRSPRSARDYMETRHGQ